MARTARSTSAAASADRERKVGDLYRGRMRLAFIRDLALGEWSYRELANQIGVPVVEVATFAAMHADEITEVRAALAGELAIETAGLWISRKHNRVAEIQALLEELREDIDIARRKEPGGKEHNNLVRSYLIAMRSAADEYLPSRTDRNSGEVDNGPSFVIEAEDEVVKAIT
jgi:hypothetical protein